MRHFTKNPVRRAMDIADREAEIVWKKIFPDKSFEELWLEIFHQVLYELSYK